MGKTSLATNIAYNVAKAYKKGTLKDGTEGSINGGVIGFFSGNECRTTRCENSLGGSRNSI